MQNVNFILKIVDNCRDILYNQIHEQKKLCKRYSLYRDIRGFDGDIHVVCVDSFFPCAFDLSNGDMRYGGIAFGGEKGGLVHVYICIHGASAGNTCVFGRKRRPGMVVSPTFGYIIAFIPTAAAAGAVRGKLPTASLKRFITAATAAFFVCYAIGIPYFLIIWRFYMGNTDIWQAALTFNILYMPKDLILCLAAAFLSKKLAPVLFSRE